MRTKVKGPSHREKVTYGMDQREKREGGKAPYVCNIDGKDEEEDKVHACNKCGTDAYGQHGDPVELDSIVKPARETAESTRSTSETGNSLSMTNRLYPDLRSGKPPSHLPPTTDIQKSSRMSKIQVFAVVFICLLALAAVYTVPSLADIDTFLPSNHHHQHDHSPCSSAPPPQCFSPSPPSTPGYSNPILTNAFGGWALSIFNFVMPAVMVVVAGLWRGVKGWMSRSIGSGEVNELPAASNTPLPPTSSLDIQGNDGLDLPASSVTPLPPPSSLDIQGKDGLDLPASSITPLPPPSSLDIQGRDGLHKVYLRLQFSQMLEYYTLDFRPNKLTLTNENRPMKVWDVYGLPLSTIPQMQDGKQSIIRNTGLLVHFDSSRVPEVGLRVLMHIVEVLNAREGKWSVSGMREWGGRGGRGGRGGKGKIGDWDGWGWVVGGDGERKGYVVYLTKGGGAS